MEAKQVDRRYPMSRNVWTGESCSKPRNEARLSLGDDLKGDAMAAEKKVTSNVRRASIDVGLKPQPKREVSQGPSPSQNTPSRRAISMDGDSKNQFQTAHILRSNYMDVKQLYHFEEELGRGAFGIVTKCTDKLTGQANACKTILKSSFRCKLDVEDLKSEVACLQALQCHASVVRLRGVFEDAKQVHLVMEYCEGGDLFSRIKRKEKYSEREAAMVCKSLASVLAFAHEKGIMHRDLKPENILMVSKESDVEIQVADFGSSAMIKPGQKLNQLIGSPLYIAPSVLNHSYGSEADLWSLGVVLYILLCGIPPFWGRTNAEIFHKIRTQPLDLEKGKISGVSREAKHLIFLLLNRNVEEAISASDVLEHPWIVKNCSAPSREKSQSTLTRRSSLSIRAQVKAAMAAAAEAQDFQDPPTLNHSNSTRNSRRYSMGVVRKGEVVLETVSEDSTPLEATRIKKSVLFRSPTPFRPAISGSDGDQDFSSDEEESTTDSEDDEEVISSESLDFCPPVLSMERKNAALMRLRGNNHGDLIKRTNSTSSDDSDIPVAEAVEVEQVHSKWLSKMKGKFIPVFRAGQRVRSYQERENIGASG